MAWHLTTVRPLKKIESPSDLITKWTVLESMEAELGIVTGQPILLPDTGRPDVDVLRYLNSGSFRRLAKQTKTSYAKDLKIFLNFLDSQNKNWQEASEEDIFNYEFWRRKDQQNKYRAGGAKFARELASIHRFYEWQVSHDRIPKNPIKIIEARGRDGVLSTSISIMPKNIRNASVKWLTPKAYRQWRDVAMGGYLPNGLQDSAWRGRTDGRNIAFTDLLWSTGLRISEGASLLTIELPRLKQGDRYARARLGESVAKCGSKRDFWLPKPVVDRIENYIKIDRRQAIERARREGRYSVNNKILIVKTVTSSRMLHYESVSGISGSIHLDQIDSDLRTLIYVRSGETVEPAFLWLSESGLPLPVDTWESIFKLANARCKRLRMPIYCHPHMLRHSFALKMLVTLMNVFDRRLGITPEERKEYRMLFGDPWVLVQNLLGHSSPEITKNVYLEPVKGVQVDLLFSEDDSNYLSVDEMLRKIASESNMVIDYFAEGSVP